MTDPLFPTLAERDHAAKVIGSMKRSNRRSFDDEREFMETLLVQRLNFLLLVYTVFVTAAFIANNYWLSAVALFIGSYVCWMMASIVRRAHVKHHWIMRLFYTLPDSIYDGCGHPIKVIDDAMRLNDERVRAAGRSVSILVGRRIPNFCWQSLLIGGVLLVEIGAYTMLFDALGESPADYHAATLLAFSDASGKAREISAEFKYRQRQGFIEVEYWDAGTKKYVLIPSSRLLYIEQ